MSDSPEDRREVPSSRQMVVAVLRALNHGPIYLAIPFLVLDAGFTRYTSKPSLLAFSLVMKRSMLTSGSTMYKVVESDDYFAASISLRAVSERITEFQLSIPDLPRNSAPSIRTLSRVYKFAKMMEYCLRSIYEDYYFAQLIEHTQTPVFIPGNDPLAEHPSPWALGAKLTPREVIDLIFDPPIDYEEEPVDVPPEISRRLLEDSSTPGSQKNLFRIRVGRPPYPEDEWLREQVYIHNKEPNDSLYHQWRARWSEGRYAKHAKLAFKYALKPKSEWK